MCTHLPFFVNLSAKWIGIHARDDFFLLADSSFLYMYSREGKVSTRAVHRND